MFAELASLYTPANVALALSPPALLAVWAVALVTAVLRYVTWSGGLYLLYYRRGAPPFLAQKIQPEPPVKAQMQREIKWSLLACLVYSFLSLALYGAGVKGWTRLYLNVADYGWGYFLASLPLMIILHDAYFYAVHRLSHRWRLVFRRFHRVHHSSLNPTPFADIMFHPVDALLHAGFVPLLLFFLPMHIFVFAFFMFFVQVINAMGHIGYEVLPPSWTRLPLLKWVSRPTAHNLHHSHVHGNYGLYFRFWDVLLDTEIHVPTAASTAVAHDQGP